MLGEEAIILCQDYFESKFEFMTISYELKFRLWMRRIRIEILSDDTVCSVAGVLYIRYLVLLVWERNGIYSYRPFEF